MALDDTDDGVDAPTPPGLDSSVDRRRNIRTAGVSYGSAVDMKDSSSSGKGKGAEQSVPTKEVGRPVITPRVRSVEAIAHQSRYRISLEEFTSFGSSFRK